jgi:hypothetical protein
MSSFSDGRWRGALPLNRSLDRHDGMIVTREEGIDSVDSTSPSSSDEEADEGADDEVAEG